MIRRSRAWPVSDVTPADWVVARIGPFGSGVGALVPHGFEAYARILHPALAADDRPVTWAEVASWSGRVVHPRAQFSALAAPASDASPARPWEDPPDPGNLPPATLVALCDVLAGHTASAERCRFCLWDGYGYGSTSNSGPIAVSATDGNAPSDEESAPGILPPKFSPSVLSGPRVELPKRSYLLFEGPLDAAGESATSIFPQSPNLFWPDDQAWCVAMEIDLDSTYLGGTTALIADVLRDERLEAVPVEVTDPVCADSDEINR